MLAAPEPELGGSGSGTSASTAAHDGVKSAGSLPYLLSVGKMDPLDLLEMGASKDLLNTETTQYVAPFAFPQHTCTAATRVTHTLTHHTLSHPQTTTRCQGMGNAVPHCRWQRPQHLLLEQDRAPHHSHCGNERRAGCTRQVLPLPLCGLSRHCGTWPALRQPLLRRATRRRHQGKALEAVLDTVRTV